jgi:WD40 repeat protein
VVLKIDKEEKYIFAGSTNGSLFIYKINEIYWNLHKILYDHSNQITSIAISNTLNAFASSSMDGYVNIYTLPDAKILRSISKNNIPIENVFLSAFPLPCIVILSNNILTSYGINGQMVLSEVEENDIICPKVFTDRNHLDYIVYFE